MKNTIKTSLATLLITVMVLPSCKKKHDDDPEPQPITLDCADIVTDKALTDVVPTAGAVDYIVPCEIAIEAAVTVSPGVVIQFAPDAGFSINGTGSLKAAGTSGSPIVMQGTTSTAGSWKGLRFTSSNVSNVLSFVTITGGGSESFDGADIKANIRVSQNAQLRISDSKIDKSGRDGIYTDGSASEELNPIKTFTNNSFSSNASYPLNLSATAGGMMDGASTFTSNGKQKICLRGAVINSANTWQKTTVPYFVSGDVIITTGSVTVSPGSSILFDAASSLGIGPFESGYLKIAGTSSQRISLSSETTTPGSWSGIAFQSVNPNNEVSYADISYGGCCEFSGNPDHKGNIVIGAFSEGAVSVSNTTVNFSSSCGIQVSAVSSFAAGAGVTFNGNIGGTVCN